MKRYVNISLMVSLTATIATVTSQAVAGKLYKWVDADGNVSYQDQPPPQDATVLDELKVRSSGSDAAATNANKDSVLVYTVDNCQPCVDTVLVLKKLGIPHIELPLLNDREAQSRILAKTQSLIAPTVMIGEQVLQGANESQITSAVKEAGYVVTEEKPTPERPVRRSYEESEDGEFDEEVFGNDE